MNMLDTLNLCNEINRDAKVQWVLTIKLKSFEAKRHVQLLLYAIDNCIIVKGRKICSTWDKI